MPSIYGATGLVPAIFAWPDPVYMPKDVSIVFEVDGELSRKALDLSLPLESRQRYRNIIGKQYCEPAYREAVDHQRLANWEIKKVVPGSMQKCEVQEDAEDILDRTKSSSRTIKDVPQAARVRALERDTAFWQVTVTVVERQKMYSKNLPELGPAEGFEANELLPEWFDVEESKN